MLLDNHKYDYIEHGKDSSCLNLLHYSVLTNKSSIAKILFKKNIDINAPSLFIGATPLHIDTRLQFKFQIF